MAYNTPNLPEIIDALTKRIRKLEIVTFSNTGVVVTEDPLIVTGLTAAITYGVDDNSTLPYANVTWNWAAVTIANPDDLDADPVVDYMFGYATTSDPNAPVVFSSTGGARTAIVRNLPINISVVGKVYAVTAKGAKGPTASLVVTITKDNVAPPQPSTPIMAAGLKQVSVTYDGKTSTAAAMPSDFKYVEVHIGTANNFTPSAATLFGVLSGGMTLIVPADNNYSPIYARFKAVDTSGNIQPTPSATATATPQKVNTTELGIVLPGDIGYSDVNNLIGDGSFENGLLRTMRFAGYKDGNWSWDNTSGIPKHGAYAAKVVANGTTNSRFMYLHYDNMAQLAPIQVVPGAKIYFSVYFRTLNYAGAVSIALRTFTQTNTSEYPSVASSTGPFTGDWKVLEGVYIVPEDVHSIAPSIRITPTSGNTGTVWFDSVQMKEMLTSVLIEDGAITRAKIGVGEITTAHIEEIDAGVIKSGYLSTTLFEGTNILGRLAQFGAVPMSDLPTNLGSELNLTGNASLDGMPSATELANLSASVNSLNDNVNSLNNIIRIDANGINISEPGSPFQITVDNDSMDFWEGSTRIAYVNGQKMYIRSAEILQQLTVGVHTIEKYDAINTFVRWVG